MLFPIIFFLSQFKKFFNKNRVHFSRRSSAFLLKVLFLYFLCIFLLKRNEHPAGETLLERTSINIQFNNYENSFTVGRHSIGRQMFQISTRVCMVFFREFLWSWFVLRFILFIIIIKFFVYIKRFNWFFFSLVDGFQQV